MFDKAIAEKFCKAIGTKDIEMANSCITIALGSADILNSLHLEPFEDLDVKLAFEPKKFIDEDDDTYVTRDMQIALRRLGFQWWQDEAETYYVMGYRSEAADNGFGKTIQSAIADWLSRDGRFDV